MNCAVCLSKYDEHSHLPQLLKPCKHTLCLECLASVYSTDFSCPICHNLISNAQPNQTIVNEINQQKQFNDSFTSDDSAISKSVSIDSNNNNNNISNGYNDEPSIKSFSTTSLLSNGNNDAILRNIDAKFVSSGKSLLSLVKPGRVFIMESLFLKECKKQQKLRYFFLFNDILMYAKKYGPNSSKLTSQHILSLAGMQIKPFISMDANLYNGFFIMTPRKSFAVYANSLREKNEWTSRLIQYINSMQSDTLSMSQQSDTLAPIFVSFTKVTNCSECKRKFNLFNNKHHCKQCGKVVCDPCSKFRYILKQFSSDPQRMCKSCFEKIQSSKLGPLNKPKEMNLNHYKEDDQVSVAFL